MRAPLDGGEGRRYYSGFGPGDGDASSLLALADEIAENRGLLTTDLVALEERFRGELAWQYHVVLDTPDGEQQTSWTFKNSPEKIYAEPVDGSTWPGYVDGSNDWVVRFWQRDYQPEAVEAQKYLAEAREDATWLDAMTVEDLDALIEIPGVLDQSVGVLRAAREYLVTTSADLSSRQQDLINSGWRDDAADRYQASIGVQVDRYAACITDIGVVDEGLVSVAEASIDVYEALSEIYLAKIDEWASFAKSAMGGSLTDWTYWAGKLADSIAAQKRKHAEDFQKKVIELGDLVKDERILDYAAGIRVDDWPRPTARGLGG